MVIRRKKLLEPLWYRPTAGPGGAVVGEGAALDAHQRGAVMTELFVETSTIGPGHVDGEGAVANCQLAEAKDGTTLSGGVPGEGASLDGRLNVLAYPGGAVLRGRVSEKSLLTTVRTPSKTLR
jgi:hypothetical protein